jgi:transcriptional regulatory protein LevR
MSFVYWDWRTGSRRPTKASNEQSGGVGPLITDRESDTASLSSHQHNIIICDNFSNHVDKLTSLISASNIYDAMRSFHQEDQDALQFRFKSSIEIVTMSRDEATTIFPAL